MLQLVLSFYPLPKLAFDFSCFYESLVLYTKLCRHLLLYYMMYRYEFPNLESKLIIYLNWAALVSSGLSAC